jgi:hypothetical protein
MSNDARRQGYRGISKNDDLEVLLALKRNILRDLKVASLGIVKSIKDNIIKVNLFPTYTNESEITIDCYCLKNLEVNKDNVVLVLFLDRNFIQNLNQKNNNQQLTKVDSKNIELHSLKYGVVIGII